MLIVSAIALAVEYYEGTTHDRHDYEGMPYVTQHTPVPIAADERAVGPSSVVRLIAMDGANVIMVLLSSL